MDDIEVILRRAVNALEQDFTEEQVKEMISSAVKKISDDEDTAKYIWIGVKSLFKNRQKINKKT
jgi:hypothetical protein